MKPPPILKKDPTRSFYQTHSQVYADATRVRALADVLVNFLRELPGDASILDLGSGGGHDLLTITRNGRFGAGLDYAESIARIARSISSAPVVVADIRAIPFRNGVFHGVWASASLLHLPRSELTGALEEVRRILRPNGLFFASVKAGKAEFQDQNGRHFVLYELDDWKKALIEAEFDLISVEYNDNIESSRNLQADRWLSSLVIRR
ncbi:class I SAM-dependent methyltransferase [Bradyrhizobium sp. 4]|uniref:class I SAM-dependent methyltransferase n=1 Tax=unclassified Bradyrhizobium TaxID=2631580 RepID=UPI001FF99FCF|nr:MULTISPECIES: class I SAM-dependent methyltransferase [unclassified Bradyrhizobium]MCK1397023.1 class I SAM-dependent methyltransferase [Bradyrhizobium sp. 39]MCK1630246.1 class I SAM-dependent methyltransferase [Bradyrhizobium sp. 162]MCK1751381.1 class I SAM-dependent methyltransferase [Bradyrhizobium sp. 135]UPJ36270.1 class I SAM-dependent methyltransferase [Bradyrhizobium sp. 4]